MFGDDTVSYITLNAVTLEKFQVYPENQYTAAMKAITNAKEAPEKPPLKWEQWSEEFSKHRPETTCSPNSPSCFGCATNNDTGRQSKQKGSYR